MKKKLLWIVFVICLAAMMAFSAGAETVATKSVDDYADLLTSSEEAQIADAIKKAEADIDCAFYVMTWRLPLGISDYDYSHRYTGETFMREHGLSQSENVVLLIISAEGNQYYYDIYRYGDAFQRIPQKECDYILDHNTVYNAIKGGELADGASAFFGLSAMAYEGRVGASYWVIGIVAFCIATVFGGMACFAVHRSYTQRKTSVDYPLDRFAKLELTVKQDHFAGTFVTKRVIQTNNGGGGGRGGSFHGGGAGHGGGR